MRFEGADCAFCFVSAVHVRWDFLVGAFPSFSDVVEVCLTCFIVHDLCIHCDAARFEPLHDDVEGRDAMVVGLECKWLYQHDVCRIVVGQHDVLVTTPRPYRESSEVVRE